jgi:hypothetical protein
MFFGVAPGSSWCGGFGVWGSGFVVQGFGSGVQGLGLRSKVHLFMNQRLHGAQIAGEGEALVTHEWVVDIGVRW